MYTPDELRQHGVKVGENCVIWTRDIDVHYSQKSEEKAQMFKVLSETRIGFDVMTFFKIGLFMVGGGL